MKTAVRLVALTGVALAAFGAYVSVKISSEMIDTEWRENDSAALFFADART